MNSRDTPDNSRYFTPEALERVEQVEFLPYSHAFERVMYDNRLTRTTTHTMDELLRVPEKILENENYPALIDTLIPSAHTDITDLVIHSTDPSNGESLLTLSFYADGLKRHVISTDDGSKITAETYADRDITMHIKQSDVGLRLLASFVFARQYDERDPDAPLRLRDNDRALPRDDKTITTEQLIMTLGELDGSSTIETTSLISSHSSTLIATLTEKESPTFTEVGSKLELSHLTKAVPEETDLHQTITNETSAVKEGRIEDRFAEKRSIDEVLRVIDPKQNHDEWAIVCDEFLEAIEDDLATHAHLDD
jgi:hypothetical protein